MRPLTLAQVIGEVTKLPSLPSVVLDVLESFELPDVDVDALARKIAQDQALAARVLRIANSSFYGLQTRVNTIPEAVVVLGFRAVRAMVMAVAATNVFPEHDCRGFDQRAFWRHCVGVGLAARALATRVDMNPEMAFTAGLLHDIGKLALVTCHPKEYAEALAYQRRHDCLQIVAERDVLGLDHTVVGNALTERWKFSAILREAVAGHHAPQDYTAASLAGVVHVANVTAHALGLEAMDDETVPPLDSTAWHRLGIGWTEYKRVLAEVEEAFDDTCQILQC